MSKALQSLTAQYTDSENEGEVEEESPDSSNSQASQVIIPKQPSPKEEKIIIEKSPKQKENKRRKRKKSVRRLVSYQDDTVISDDDEEESTSSESSNPSEDEGENDETSSHSNAQTSRDTTNSVQMEVDENNDLVNDTKSPKKVDKLSKYAHYGFSLPPEPKGKPSVELVDKIKHLYDKMETTNMDMNRVIQGRKEFRNPSIYEKLIQYCDINEFGTNYPPEIYDPLQWGPESYYEELARIQKNGMLKRQKERKDTDKIEQATALARKVEEEAKRRKSKWDQPAASVKPIPPTLTTTVTGTKGTVISAFGSLPKKPAV
ncbi:SAP30-binding protein [Bactrocera dorsalis]|uniref:SAP30-binding protein n=1 Tax=Bactrocera dorsalis TaxID=27457 RepID=A0A6I9VHX3_BACDO|nr:SAP30-binding protein [Bactrocera dorsalis]